MTDLDQAAGNVSGICRLDDFPIRASGWGPPP
jgi:hypothetical protein